MATAHCGHGNTSEEEQRRHARHGRPYETRDVRRSAERQRTVPRSASSLPVAAAPSLTGNLAGTYVLSNKDAAREMLSALARCRHAEVQLIKEATGFKGIEVTPLDAGVVSLELYGIPTMLVSENAIAIQRNARVRDMGARMFNTVAASRRMPLAILPRASKAGDGPADTHDENNFYLVTDRGVVICKTCAGLCVVRGSGSGMYYLSSECIPTVVVAVDPEGTLLPPGPSIVIVGPCCVYSAM